MKLHDALEIVGAAVLEQNVVEAALNVESQRKLREERETAWKRAIELQKLQSGGHVLMDKHGKGSREVFATNFHNGRKRLVLIPYTEIEQRTARRVGVIQTKAGIVVRGNFHETWVNADRVKQRKSA